jgi:hypothetical protein
MKIRLQSWDVVPGKRVVAGVDALAGHVALKVHRRRNIKAVVLS